MEGIDNKVVIGSIFGLGIAALSGAALYHHLNPPEDMSAPQQVTDLVYETKIIALIGDVGGTNLRFQLLEISGCAYEDVKEFKSQKLRVSEFQQFSQAIQHFLKGTGVHPSICVIAIAGPVDDNSILMSNVQRWGLLDGSKLGVQLKINRFLFVNDFQANAYAIMTLKDQDIVKVNGLEPIDTQHKLIIGPGTGLGTASLIAVPSVLGKNQNFVAPGQGGHIGFAPSNDEQREYYAFLKKYIIQPIIVLEQVFCGPAIPYMYRFFAEKFPGYQGSELTPSAQEIIRIGVQHPDTLHRKAVKLFLDIYGNVVCDQILTKLCYGGLYLQGSITHSVIPLILDQEFGWLREYKQKRPYLKHIFDKVPIVAIKVDNLGLRGAFVYARKLTG